MFLCTFSFSGIGCSSVGIVYLTGEHFGIIRSLYLSFCILNLVHLLRTSITLDTITPTQSIRDGDTLASADRRFQMGFFSPDNSKSRYVGIWYPVSSRTVVWVANRDTPLNDHSGLLKVTDGVVILLNSTNSTVWSSNTSRTAEIQFYSS